MRKHLLLDSSCLCWFVLVVAVAFPLGKRILLTGCSCLTTARLNMSEDAGLPVGSTTTTSNNSRSASAATTDEDTSLIQKIQSGQLPRLEFESLIKSDYPGLSQNQTNRKAKRLKHRKHRRRQQRRREGKNRTKERLTKGPLTDGNFLDDQSGVVISTADALQKDMCQTMRLKQKINIRGCISKTVINSFCYGQCNSFFIPQPGGFGSRLRPAFESYSVCKPRELTRIMIKLHCPMRERTFVTRTFLKVKRCVCTPAQTNVMEIIV